MKIVFNAHAHWSIADKDIGLLAKIGEILRMSPKEAMSSEGPALEVEEVLLRGQSKGKIDTESATTTASRFLGCRARRHR